MKKFGLLINFGFLVAICIASDRNAIYAQRAASYNNEVASALDSWSNRTTARNKILKLGPESSAVEVLSSIARSGTEPHLRTQRAIMLLATFNSKASTEALAQVAGRAKPVYRCLAIQSLAEIGPQEAIPVLIQRLNDRSVCMTTTSTDPHEERSVYVCDEAVRLLELLTGKSFGAADPSGHRRTEPWKKWWEEQKRQGAPSPDNRGLPGTEGTGINPIR